MKWRHKTNAHLKNEKLKGVEQRQRVIVEGEVHLCEPKQLGPILGENNEDAKRRSAQDPLNYLGSSNQHEESMYKASNKATKPYVFKINDFCMFAGCIINEEG